LGAVASHPSPRSVTRSLLVRHRFWDSVRGTVITGAATLFALTILLNLTKPDV